GTPLSRRILRDVTTDLLADGPWADVQIDARPLGDGVELLDDLRPRTTLFRVEFRMHERLSEVDLRRAAQLSSGDITTTEKIDAATARIIDAYREVGYRHATVRPELRDTDTIGSRVLVLHIDEGHPTTIGRIRYAKQRPPHASGFEGAANISGGDVLDESQLEEAIREAAKVARNNGFYEALITAPRVEIDGFTADIYIDAHFGPRYVLDIA